MSKREVPVKKNQTITLEFEDLTHEGSGVGKVNGYPLFVAHSLPDEKATVKVIKVNKRLVYRKLIEVLNERLEREQPEHESGDDPLKNNSYTHTLQMTHKKIKTIIKQDI